MNRIFTAVFCILFAHAAHSGILDRQIAEARQAAQKYASFSVAQKEGWRPFGADVPLMGQHFQLRNGPDYVSGDALDFSKPSNLVFAEIRGRKELVALAYVVRKRPDEPLPTGFAGQSDIWHIHDGRRFLAALSETRPVIGRLAGRWFQNKVTHNDGRIQLAMVHLWLIPNPKGPFASHNPRLPYLDLGLPASWAGDMGTARGLALALPDGCGRMLDAELNLSGASRRTVRRIKRACEGFSKKVRAVVATDRSQMSATARQAWENLSFTVQAELTPDEFRRSKAFVEDGPGICR
ncbi:MAG: hypothetical protein OXC60_03520 [Litoreibacter sp.]|nr:hypothetical protein [Litoreibacter sp.]